MAIDPGEVRVGLAISDPLCITAQPLGTIEVKGRKSLVHELCRLVRENGVHRVVIGLPLLLSGEEGAKAREARELSGLLQDSLDDVTVELWDERLTTAQAERVMISGNVKRRRRRKKIDVMAATIILQSYLDAAGNRSRTI